MDPQRWQEIKEILSEACALAPRERESYLRRACGEDADLRQEVESVLAFEGDSRDFLDRPLFDINAEDPAVGRRIDHYRIVRPLGRGGMGAVYLATREDDYAQEVALKLIQRGIGSHDLVARFHEERQILADLDHPAIARLLDGGTTDEGLPYLVLERVEGEPIDQYCDRCRLGSRQRLQLFRQVLAAVHYSHQHLVVHRDLKPGNILVTSEGSPKLIDFGIAKLLRPSGGDEPPAARQRQLRLSPPYASPEQVRGERITTASDVYALGVLLYRLLTGRHPYSLEAATEEELVRAICESEPLPPSAAVARAGPDAAEAARARGTTPAKLRRRLADELDAIVLKAMGKRPEARYGSVEKLSEDLGRYLEGQPVHARAGSPAYRGRKFLQRHRLPLAAAALALALAGFLLANRILRARLEQERARVEAIGEFIEDLFWESDPDRAQGEELTAREILERASVSVGSGLEDHPMIRIEVSAVLGRVYQKLGDLAEARRLLTEARRLQSEHDPGDDVAMARRANELAAVYHELGDPRAAETLYREALARIGGCRSPEPNARWIAYNLVVLLNELGDFDEAEELNRCLQEEREDPLSPADVAHDLSVKAQQYFGRGEPKKAAELFRWVLEIRLEEYGLESTRVANAYNNLGGALLAAGQAEEAEAKLRQALDIRRRLLDSDHLDVANTEKNLAWALTVLGRAGAAEPLARHAVNVFLGSRKAGWRLADAESVLGGCLAALGRYAEAEPLLRGSYPRVEAEKGEQSPYTIAARERIANLERAMEAAEGRRPRSERAPEGKKQPGRAPAAEQKE